MNKQIRTYEDLLEEQARLQSLLAVQKAIVQNDIREIKEELAPVRSAISFAGKLLTRDHSNILLNAGTNKLIDLFIKKLLLSKTGWITRLVVPFFLKNYSSHIISEKKDAILHWLTSFLTRKNANGQEKAPVEE